MMKAVWSGIAAAVLLVGCAATVSAQSDTATLSVTANVSARAKLVLSVANITFNDADPDVSGTLSAPAFDVTVKGRTTATGSLTLSVLADGDLVDGSNVIGIDKLSWTGTGSGFALTGTASKATEQNVGTWVGSKSVTGTQTLHLVNDWTYATGAYTATLTYTLSAS